MDNRKNKDKFTFYNDQGQSYSLDWSFFNRKKRKDSLDQGLPPIIPCPKCKKGLKLVCQNCENGDLKSNPLHPDELICKNCCKVTSSIYCSCGFKLSTHYLQKKLKAVKQIMRDGDYREYLAIFATIMVYAIVIWGIIAIGSQLNHP